MTVKMSRREKFCGIIMFKDRKGVCMKTDISISFQSPKNGAKHYGLDTSIKAHFSSAVHNTTMAINLARAVAKR